MKLRIHKNSIRLRLDRNDFYELSDRNVLIQSLETSTYKWNFSILLAEVFKVELSNEGFKFFIPHSDFDNLKSTKLEYLKYIVDNLKISIEKEYSCLHPSELKTQKKSDSAFFPRPTEESNQ
tara:strand:- start:1590 stop:1955 length:366 start_codon:yes stop_codon:yes gene_type:complete